MTNFEFLSKAFKDANIVDDLTKGERIIIFSAMNQIRLEENELVNNKWRDKIQERIDDLEKSLNKNPNWINVTPKFIKEQYINDLLFLLNC